MILEPFRTAFFVLHQPTTCGLPPETFGLLNPFDPFRAWKSLTILSSGIFVPPKGFSIVKALKLNQFWTNFLLKLKFFLGETRLVGICVCVLEDESSWDLLLLFFFGGGGICWNFCVFWNWTIFFCYALNRFFFCWGEQDLLVFVWNTVGRSENGWPYLFNCLCSELH